MGTIPLDAHTLGMIAATLVPVAIFAASLMFAIALFALDGDARATTSNRLLASKAGRCALTPKPAPLMPMRKVFIALP